MRFFIFLIFIITQVSCMAQMNEISQDEGKTKIEETQANYLALGDSYTIGHSVEEKDRFPVILSTKLSRLGLSFTEPRIVAKTGWTTDELSDAIEGESIQDTFDLVTLLIGVNNQYRGRDIEEFRFQFRNLLIRALDFAGGNVENVIVISIPDWGVSPFAENQDQAKISQEIDQFNAVKKEETLAHGVAFVNITEISRQAKGKAEYFALDGLHFSGLMHSLWVDAIIEQCFN